MPHSATSDLLVCATDFSVEASSALEWALAFARREGAAIDLVHVLPDPTQDREALAADAATFEAAQLDAARERLSRIAGEAARTASVTVRPEILTGAPDVAVVDHARGHGARMIVMGASGRSAIDRWVLGSAAERTVRSASVPVVVVPRHEPGQAWFPAAETGNGRRLKALVGLEGDDFAALVTFAAGLRRSEAFDVTFLHLYWPTEEFERLGLRGARDPLAPDPDVVNDLEPKLRARIGGLPGRGEVSVLVRPAWGDPAANLLQAVGEDAYDLLIVGAHQRHGFARALTGSIAERVARHAARTPIVCVPTGGSARAEGSKAPAIPRILTVLAPTDLSALGNVAVPHAYALLRATGGVVELCHVYEHGLPNPPYAYDGPLRLSAAARAALIKALRALVPREAETLGITTHISVIDGGKPSETIVQAAERLNVDAISLASHGRGGLKRALLGSVAEEVVRRSSRPVLVVHGARA
jgi:nucleotide-binding universal stress UspA family protein